MLAACSGDDALSASKPGPTVPGSPFTAPDTQDVPTAYPTHLGPGQFLLNGGVAGLHVARELEVVDGVFVATVHSLRKKPNPGARERLINSPQTAQRGASRALCWASDTRERALGQDTSCEYVKQQ